MLESRWGRRAGPALATLGALLVVASTAVGAPSVEDRPPPGCDGPPSTASDIGAWFALEPVIDRGALTAQRLRVGTLQGAGWTIALPPEAWATGPVQGRVLFGSDDGRASTVRQFDGAAGCVSGLATTAHIVRSAVLDPAGGAVHEHRLARADRSDLGIWRRSDPGEAAQRILGPLAADDRFGPTWRTDLVWSDDGTALVVASCGELACRFRVVERSGAVHTVEDPDLGALVAMAGDHLLVRGACRGLPCPLLAVDPVTGARTVLDPAAGPAAPIAGAEGTEVVVGTTAGLDGARIRGMDADGRRGRTIDSEDALVVPDAGYGADLPPGWFLVLSDPAERTPTLLARSLFDGPRPLHEVPR